MFVKKVFPLVKPFLAYEYPKNAEFHPDFKSVEIIEKSAPRKVFCQKLLQVRSIEEETLQLCTLLLPITFLLVNFSHFSQQFRNQRKILHYFDTQLQILGRKRF